MVHVDTRNHMYKGKSTTDSPDPELRKNVCLGHTPVDDLSRPGSGHVLSPCHG